MNALTRIVVLGFFGSFEVTVIDLVCRFFFVPVLKVTLMLPSPPGGMAVLVRTAAVHPQEPLALISLSGASPLLITRKLCETFEPRGTVPKSCSGSGK